MAQWSARIDSLSSVTLGAAFLIDPGRLLTCAHVVRGEPEVRVIFPGSRQYSAGVNAVVAPLTGWTQSDDDGDMVVLQLTNPVTIPPAQFVRPVGRYWAGELRAHGFRRGLESSGSYVNLRTSPGMELREEWWQLRVKGPETLAHGFSGAAVYRADTGEVIGMVTDADIQNGGRMGRLLPLSVLRRHWEDLDDLMPLPWLNPSKRQTLRKIVHSAPARAEFRQIYMEAFPDLPPAYEFRSAWDAIRYVAEELLEPDVETRVNRFVGKLSQHLHDETARQLTAWRRRSLPHAVVASDRPSRPKPTSIMVRLERRTRGDIYDLTLSTLVGGTVGRTIPTFEVRGPDVRRTVEKYMTTLVEDVVGLDWMIEFALPESWLNKPVEEWRADKNPMLVYPVIVRDVERLRPTFRQDWAIRRWALLRRRAQTRPESVGCCDPRKNRQFFFWLASDEEICVLVHAQRPLPSQLTSALEAGIPVMLWPRTPCPDHTHDNCIGQQVAQELTKLVAEADPDDLPVLVRKLRTQAMSQSSNHSHCGRRLTLLWDDPSRLPDPPLAMPM